MLKFSLASITALALAACATSPDGAGQDASDSAAANAGERDCFTVRNINGYSEVDRNTIRVRTGVDDYYDVDVYPGCLTLGWENQLLFQSRSGSFICVGDPQPGSIKTGDETCLIDEVRRVYLEAEAETAEQAAADAER